jgi:iron(III) transport system substrate-binding protein
MLRTTQTVAEVHRRSHRPGLAILAAAVLLLIALVAGPPAEAQMKPGVTAEERAAAKREGEVNYYSANATAHGTAMKEAAERALGIKVNFVRLSSGLLYTRVLKEFDTNIHTADVVESSVIAHYLDFKKRGILRPFVPSSLPLYRGKEYYDPEHYWHAGSVSLGAINYNTNAIKGDMIPMSWKDLLDAKYKNKVVQGHLKASGTTAVVTYHLVKLYGWEYFQALRDNNVLTQTSCDVLTILASGERVVAPCDYQMSGPAKAQNLPIETVFPREGAFGYVRPVAVMAKAPHPNAAKLFAEWLLSPTGGQTVNVQHGGLTSPMDSPDIKYPDYFPGMGKIKVHVADPKEFEDWLPEGRRRFSELFGG